MQGDVLRTSQAACFHFPPNTQVYQNITLRVYGRSLVCNTVHSHIVARHYHASTYMYYLCSHSNRDAQFKVGYADLVRGFT